jgi:RecA/RadA recombinase
MAFDITQQFRDTFKKENLGEEIKYTPSHSTGIDILDYHNGRIEYEEEKLGVDGGKVITIIGKSGVGKSSLAIQIAGNIVKDHKDGQVIHLDFERATNPGRIQMLTGWSHEDIKKRYLHLEQGIYSETMYKMTKSIAKIKKENFDKIKIDTGKKDDDGNTIYMYPPTVMLIDSWATMVPENISEEEELSGSMSASSIAKTNNAVIKRIVGALAEVNIILIIVNHVTKKIEIGMQKTQADLNYLKQDESIPGGTSCIYLANTLLKLTASSKLDPDKEYGIKGFVIIGELLKSRSNASGIRFEMVYSQEEGYLNHYTNLRMVKAEKLLQGSPRAYYVDADPEVKFTQKAFGEKYSSNKEFAGKFDATSRELLGQFLSGRKLQTSLDAENADELDMDDDFELVEQVEGDIYLGSDKQYYRYDEEAGSAALVKDYKPKKKK